MNLRPILLLPVLLFLTPTAQGETRQSEASIRLSVDTVRQREAGFLMEEGMEDQISEVVRTMYHDTRGDLWFGTQDGVCRYDGTALVYYDIRDQNDQGITVRDIVEDRDGNIWFGTSGGVTRFDGEFFTTFTEEPGSARPCSRQTSPTRYMDRQAWGIAHRSPGASSQACAVTW